MLPQALRAVIPAIVGQAIGLFKDTSLVFIVGLMDFFKVGDVVTAQPDALLTAVETRSSCPVQAHRDECFRGTLPGVYPAGEGAGRAGGIMSAAVDGLRCAQMMMQNASAGSL